MKNTLGILHLLTLTREHLTLDQIAQHYGILFTGERLSPFEIKESLDILIQNGNVDYVPGQDLRHRYFSLYVYEPLLHIWPKSTPIREFAYQK